MFELDLILLDERKSIEIVYKYASGLMYDFLGETNYRFFLWFLENFPEEYHVSHCYGISKSNNELFEMSI